MSEFSLRGKIISAVFASALIILLSQNAYAESTYDEKLEFAKALEETLGHFWAIEQNLDEGNAKLALVHATHPIAELYDSIKPELKEANPDFDARVQKTLLELGKKTGSDVTRQNAQDALDDAKKIIQEARILVVGELSDDLIFKTKLIQGLLKTSINEYQEGVQNGQIELMAEFQDGSAFVWKSQQIFDEIKSELPEHEVKESEEFYSEIWDAYNKRSDPEQIATFANGIINEISDAIGDETEETNLLQYVENIHNLLNQVKITYADGDKDAALSFATKAYLDNFEHLEGPLKETGNTELVSEIEEMLREELRAMIKNEASSAEVDQQVDSILEKMESVKVAVPEFGSIVTVALAIAIIGTIIATSRRTGLKSITRK